MKYIEQDKEAVMRAMRALNDAEEVKEDGKFVPEKPTKGGPGKRNLKDRPALDDKEALHRITRA